MITLFSAQTTDGNSSEITQTAGRLKLFAFGTWDGATVTVTTSPDGTTFLTAASFTANGVNVIEVATNEVVRAELSSAGASTSVSLLVGRTKWEQ